MGRTTLGAGPTFPSQTKRFDDFAGLDYLRQVAAEIRLPIFAIGGISQQNLPQVLATGINRVAVGAAITDGQRTGLRGPRIVEYAECDERMMLQPRSAPQATRPRFPALDS